MRRPTFAAGLLLALPTLLPAQPAQPASPANAQLLEFFENKVRPVLAEHCFKCHGDVKKPKGDLRVDSLGALLTGGDVFVRIAAARQLARTAHALCRVDSVRIALLGGREVGVAVAATRGHAHSLECMPPVGARR